MSKKILLLLLPILMIYCSKKKEIVEKYGNDNISQRYYLEDALISGKYEEFYENGNPKTISIYEKGIKQDSSVYYYNTPKNVVKTIKYWKNDNAYYQKYFFENGRLMRKGSLLRDNFRIGKWDIYSPKNYKSEVIEYLNINGNSYVNQNWKLNNMGDTIVGGIYYELIKKDVANDREPYRIHFFLKQRLLVNSEAFVYVPNEGYSCKEDFSNENQIKWKKIDNVAKWHKDFPNRKHDVILSFWTKKVTNDTLRGYIVEKEVQKNNTDLDSVTRKTYFNIPYVIKLGNASD